MPPGFKLNPVDESYYVPNAIKIKRNGRICNARLAAVETDLNCLPENLSF